MSFIPKDARWYLADVVLEHRIDGDPENVVHVNTHLVEAGSPHEAYEKALALGRAGEREYENTDGRVVRVVFRGLRELNVIHEPLEDGAEIMYAEEVGVPEERLREWVRPRERLGVFARSGTSPRGRITSRARSSRSRRGWPRTSSGEVVTPNQMAAADHGAGRYYVTATPRPPGRRARSVGRRRRGRTSRPTVCAGASSRGRPNVRH